MKIRYTITNMPLEGEVDIDDSKVKFHAEMPPEVIKSQVQRLVVQQLVRDGAKIEIKEVIP